MTMVKFSPRPFEKTFNSLFEDIFQNLPGQDWNQRFTQDYVPVNIRETKDGFLVDVIAPGLEKQDFKIRLEDNLLTIAAEKKQEQKQEDGKTVKKEFSLKSFSRSFRLDEAIQASKIEAKYEHGILQLTLPKKEEVKVVPQEICVN